MSLISFLKDAGERLFNAGKPAPAAPAQAQRNVADMNATAGEAIEKYITSQNLSADNLDVKFDGATQTVAVSGVAADQSTKEKIVLCCGNVQGVAHVDDQLTVAKSAEPVSTFYTVVKGDTLSKIAGNVYGSPKAYMKIFEANKPMLTDPDKIYPGQTLRIPAAT